ncbi:MAG: glycosyltransferase family 4 protein [Elusimicrobia bacterium]|nr:glycosyltransferase family 4 protein [Elusimicrobiota bacterium]
MPRPLRIAMAVRDARSLSGTTTLARELAAGAAKAGHTVRLLSWRPPAAPPLGVRSHRVAMVPFCSTLRAWSFDLAARLAARALRADIVHGHGDLTRQDVLTVNNVDAAEAQYAGRPRVGSAGTLFVRRRQFEAASCIVTVSERARRDLARFYDVDPARVEVIPPGVDSGRFTPEGKDEARRELQAKLGLPAGSRILLSLISGDAQRRNIEGLLEAFSRAKLGKEWILLVVGDVHAAEHPASTALRAAGRLRTLPRTDRPERVYRACDAFILPAHYETFGLTALEAMASGLATAVTSTCGAAELLQDGVNALVLPDSRDLDAMARAIELLAEGKTAARLAEGGLRLARERGWSGMVEAYLALYDRVHRKKNGR